MEIETISASEFKAKCLDLFNKLASHQIKRLTITKHGKPVAIMMPPEKPGKAESLFGCMKDRTIIPEGFDFTKPALEEELDAEKGVLHR